MDDHTLSRLLRFDDRMVDFDLLSNKGRDIRLDTSSTEPNYNHSRDETAQGRTIVNGNRKGGDEQDDDAD